MTVLLSLALSGGECGILLSNCCKLSTLAAITLLLENGLSWKEVTCHISAAVVTLSKGVIPVGLLGLRGRHVRCLLSSCGNLWHCHFRNLLILLS